jgi:hypothetical protein
MICETVSRKEIRALKVGQVAIYTLPDKRAVECARVQFSSMKDREEADFDRVPMDELKNMLGNDFAVVVPNERLTIAYRKTKAGIYDEEIN